jgi:hypothetical protein
MRPIWKAGTCLLLVPLVASCASAAVDTAPPAGVEEDARRFMAGYAADLLSHNTDAIVARYCRRGTYVVLPGDWKMQQHDSIARLYREAWQGPVAWGAGATAAEPKDPGARYVRLALALDAATQGGYVFAYRR